MVHFTLSRNTQLEDIVTLRIEVREVLQSEDCSLFLPVQMLRIKDEDAPTSELRGWIFQFYATCQCYESYEEINDRVK